MMTFSTEKAQGLELPPQLWDDNMVLQHQQAVYFRICLAEPTGLAKIVSQRPVNV